MMCLMPRSVELAFTRRYHRGAILISLNHFSNSSRGRPARALPLLATAEGLAKFLQLMPDRECGGKLAELSQKSFEELGKLLPPHWSRGNPVDILGDANAERYQKAVEIVARDENNDGLLAILTPQAMTGF